MNNRITDELQSFLKDYAAEPSPRDFAIAQHFYNLALEDVKKEARRLSMADPYHPASHRKLDILIEFIDNQKQ